MMGGKMWTRIISKTPLVLILQMVVNIRSTKLIFPTCFVFLQQSFAPMQALLSVSNMIPACSYSYSQSCCSDSYNINN